MKVVFACIYIILFAAFSPFVKSQEQIQVFTELFPPYQQLNDSGDIDGWSTQLVKKILDEAKIDYQITVYPWPRTYRLASQQPNTLIYSLLRNKPRESLFYWIAPLCKIQTYFYKFKYRDDISVNDLEDARKYVIGIGRDQPHLEFLIDSGFIINENLVEVTSNAQLQQMMKRDRVDLIMASRHFVEALKKNSSADFHDIEPIYFIHEFKQQLYLAANLETSPEVLKRIKRAFDTIKPTMPADCSDVHSNALNSTPFQQGYNREKNDG